MIETDTDAVTALPRGGEDAADFAARAGAGTRLIACSRFEIGRHRVAHAGNSHSDRALRDDLCIHQDKVRICREKYIFLEYAFICVYY